MWRYLALFLLLPNSSLSSDHFSEIQQLCVALDDVLSWAKAHHYLLIVDFMFSIRVAQGTELASKTCFYLSSYFEDFNIQFVEIFV